MARVSSKIPRAYRLSLFALLLTSWSTGIAFFILRRWVTVEGEFGPEQHPWQFAILRTHGGAAFLMMISYGFLLASHVPAGRRAQRMRRLGGGLVALQGFLILSAYLLYYAADDRFRVVIGYAHASTGFVFPFLLMAHLYSAKLDRKTSSPAPARASRPRDAKAVPQPRIEKSPNAQRH